MTDTEHLHFPCPSCGEKLTPQAHGIVIPAQGDFPKPLLGCFWGGIEVS
jgi:hypothetical protein